MHILPNISRSKSNQTTKFGHLVEYNMKNIFLKRSYPESGGEASPRPFSKKIKIKHIFESTVWKFIVIFFNVCPSCGLPKYVETKVLIIRFYPI